MLQSLAPQIRHNIKARMVVLLGNCLVASTSALTHYFYPAFIYVKHTQAQFFLKVCPHAYCQEITLPEKG